MAKTDRSPHIVNTNVNVMVNANHSEAISKEARKHTNWLLKAILGGLITIAVSVCVYYIRKEMDAKGKSLPRFEQRE